jgi:hypothetical protein
MVGGLTEWDKWWAKPAQLGCTLQSLSYDANQLVELLQRRHVVTHTAGRASDRYVRLTSSGVARGELLRVTPEYVRAGLENLSAVGLRLALLTAKKFLPAGAMQAVAATVFLVVRQDPPVAGFWQLYRRWQHQRPTWAFRRTGPLSCGSCRTGLAWS